MLRIKLLILALFGVLAASAQLPPVLPMTIGSGVPTGNNYIFVDSASVRPAVSNVTVVATPARNYTNSTIIFAQAVDYPTTPAQASTLTDNKGNTYVNVFTQTVGVQNMRVRYYMCYNPDITGGNVILTYSSSGGIVNYPTFYAQGYRGVTSLPTYVTNSNTSTSSISSISTNSVTTTAANSLVISSVGTQAAVITAPTVSGSVTVSERMNWFPLVSSTNVFSASYNSIKSGTGTFSVTHTTSGVNFATQTIATIIAFQ